MLNGMINFDFDFEKMYGKPYDKMNRKEKDIALFNMLYQACKRTKSIPWLERMAWAATVIIPTIIGLLIWLIKMHMII